jgi:hypothetical protein
MPGIRFDVVQISPAGGVNKPAGDEVFDLEWFGAHDARKGKRPTPNVQSANGRIRRGERRTSNA